MNPEEQLYCNLLFRRVVAQDFQRFVIFFLINLYFLCSSWSKGTQKEASDNPNLFSLAVISHIISESSNTFSHSSSLTVCCL